jgi:hypothetical protein
MDEKAAIKLVKMLNSDEFVALIVARVTDNVTQNIMALLRTTEVRLNKLDEIGFVLSAQFKAHTAISKALYEALTERTNG